MSADVLVPGAVRACVFDAYGTLFDTSSVVLGHAQLLGVRAAPLATLWREKQLAYTWLRAAQGRHADFQRVTADALSHALEALDLPGEIHGGLMRAYDLLLPFADAATTLARLRARGQRLAILSNGTPQMLEALLGHSGLTSALDFVWSVEEVGAFKPAPEVYRLATERLQLPAEEIAFVSANGWDAHAAAAFGLQSIWCRRAAQTPERLPGSPRAVVGSLQAVADLLAP
jgi:2-haloacid dehalogenase